MQFIHVRLEHLHHHIIISHIGNSSPTLYHYILANNSQAIYQEISILHHNNLNKYYHRVYINITSSLIIRNHNWSKGISSQDLHVLLYWPSSKILPSIIQFNQKMGVISSNIVINKIMKSNNSLHINSSLVHNLRLGIWVNFMI